MVYTKKDLDRMKRSQGLPTNLKFKGYIIEIDTFEEAKHLDEAKIELSPGDNISSLTFSGAFNKYVDNKYHLSRKDYNREFTLTTSCHPLEGYMVHDWDEIRSYLMEQINNDELYYYISFLVQYEEIDHDEFRTRTM
jgi:hypothetical protein